MSLSLSARPRLVRWARLRLDPKSGSYVLLYPEKGLFLNATGAQIVKYCTGRRTLAEILACLASEHPGADPTELRSEARRFLDEFSKRGLLRTGP